MLQIVFAHFVFVAFLIACSTKKDRLINRKFQALNTEFNVLHNGNLSLEAGLKDIVTMIVQGVKIDQSNGPQVTPWMRLNAGLDKSNNLVSEVAWD